MLLSSVLKIKKENEFIFGILLKENEGKVVLIKEGKIIDQIKFSYTNNWENLIEDIDEVLYQLENKHNIHVEQTIFFLYSHLIDHNGNIKLPYQQKIKTIVKELELKPLGYIECREAISKIYEENEQNLLTAILIEIDLNYISVFIYKGGRLEYGKTIARTDNFIDDFLESIKKITNQIILPTKIILYNSQNLDKEITEIINYRWPTNIFLQIPKVEIIKEDELIKYLVELFNNQLQEAKNSHSKPVEVEGFLIEEDIKNKSQFIVNSGKKNIFNFFSFLKKIKLPRTNFKPNLSKNKNFVLFIGILTILSVFFINEYFFHKLLLNLYLPTKNIKKDITSSYGTNNNKELNLENIKKNFSVSVNKQTTGEKEIGTPAKGKVTIYNFSKEITFPKGTILIAQNQEFILEDETKVASFSFAPDNSAKLPGKIEANIIAKEIGPQGNLSENQTFVIKDYDNETYFAKNQNPLTGGTKKKITTVSKKDLEQLEKLALEKIKKEAVIKEIAKDKKIIDQLTNYSFKKKSFSKEIGEEADSISLTAEIEGEFFAYKKDRLINLIFNKIKDDVSDDYQINKDKIVYQISNLDEKNNTLNINLEIIAIKKIDKEKVVKKLLGKNINQISSILKNEFQVSGYKEIHKQPLKIPFYKNFLPFFQKNIIINIKNL